jgi:hypothetical protein
LGHSCETGWIKHDSSYYSKQNSKVLPQGKILAMLSTPVSVLIHISSLKAVGSRADIMN